MTNPLYEIPTSEKGLADAVPEHLRGGLARYVIHGVMPGHFLRAAIANNFAAAVCKADDPSSLRPLALFLLNCMPIASHGTDHAIVAWVDKGGLNGRKRA